MTLKNNTNKKVHLIGICGSGMAALAVLFKESGWSVTGSDEGVFEPMPSYLTKNKITFYDTYDGAHIPKDADLIIIGNNIPLSVEENVEKKEAVKLGLKIESFPEALAMLSKNTENIVVVGSSGKSTTTGLLAWCLHVAKKDPSYFIGALPLDLENSSHIGKGKDFVLEGDEYTSSKEDSRSKFLHFKPTSVLLTSAAHDHVNIFPTEESYKEPFKKFVATIPKNGLFVYALNGKNNTEIAEHTACINLSYGVDDRSADWYAENIQYGMETSFDLMNKGEKIITIKSHLLGKHNIENIVGVGALLLESKKMTPEVFAKATENFHGIKNRIELKTNGTIPVYIGFGSSYEKAKSIFDTMRLHFPNERIITVFEPHAFSWRNRNFLHWYKDVFNNVDEVIMLPATGHGKKAPDQLDTDEVWSEAKKYKDIHTINTEQEGLDMLTKMVKKDDVVVLVSSGDLFGLAQSVPKLFAEQK